MQQGKAAKEAAIKMRRLARPPDPAAASADYAKARALLLKVTDDSVKEYLASKEGAGEHVFL